MVDDEDRKWRGFVHGRVSGEYGIAVREWGIGFSVRFGNTVFELVSARFQFGPFWLDVDVLKKGWS